MMNSHTNNGLLVVLSGPSGSGKDTVLCELLRRNPEICLSTSLTTRAKREWEIDGKHYYFVTHEYFQRKLAEGMILEHAQYGENFYGTPKQPVDDMLAQGKTVILEIEVQGAEKIRTLYPDVCSVFLAPPSMPILEQRLRMRESEDEEDIRRRLTIAAQEMLRAGEYDYITINHNVADAAQDLDAIIRAERLRSCRSKYLLSEVTQYAES